MNLNLNFFLVIIIATSFLTIVEISKRKFSLSSNITRKISHIGGALIAALAPYYLEKKLLVLACLGFAIFMYFSQKHSLFSSIHQVNRSTLGEVFLPLGEAISAIIFLPQSLAAYQFGVLIMGLSDASASFVGDKIGKHRIYFLGAKKSIEGSLAFFITALLLTYIFAPYVGTHLFVIPLILTSAELGLSYGTDNLVLPLLGAYLLLLIH